jgi:hypothetical protein
LTEILMSRKSCSSNSEHSHSADSTSASGRRLAVLRHDPLVEAAGVDADPDRGAGGLGGAGHLADLAVELADVAGLTRTAAQPGVDRREDVLALEVDVGDHRDLRLLDDLRQRLGVDRVGHGDAHDLAAGGRQRSDLLQRRVDVGGHRRRHRLHADGAPPPTSTPPTSS